MKRIAFFTAGMTPTTQEAAQIATINSQAAQPYEVIVMNALANPNYGYGKLVADYAAGSPPSAYSAVPVYNPANPPNPPLVATKAIVSNAQELAVPVTGTYVTKATVTVVNNVVTAIALS